MLLGILLLADVVSQTSKTPDRMTAAQAKAEPTPRIQGRSPPQALRCQWNEIL